ncbi:predicted protein [Lichtheimia corymbifera JMRC:FSU:9682]|uniref:Uncharacterized protein n=1 Tax=Lichtheimia corymbifera JMRC:FSU:9682 TaxID=1263082 RepID=A0A068RPI3_9FUNG|nr:predicted protein [Lichtheimia corymbifera JMRC:FSU:9682]
MHTDSNGRCHISYQVHHNASYLRLGGAAMKMTKKQMDQQQDGKGCVSAASKCSFNRHGYDGWMQSNAVTRKERQQGDESCHLDTPESDDGLDGIESRLIS